MLYLIPFSFVSQSFIYFLLTLGLEIYPSLKLTPFKIKKWWGKINIFPHNTTYLEPLLESSPETFVTDLNEDVDVKAERNRVLSGSIDNAIIYLRNLRKVFPRIVFFNFLFIESIVLWLPWRFLFWIEGVFWREESWEKGCSRFINFLSSGRRMFWFFRNKWSWKDHNAFYVMRYIIFLGMLMFWLANLFSKILLKSALLKNNLLIS